ncbi:hypothetical protein LTR66_006913 [Elasticomyces elasticus]|nr:hypothetical protein LTR66_006913 [Elasticomyces elasticus]
MPAQRPRATFRPIPPQFNLRRLVEDTPNFKWADRITCDMIAEQNLDAFEKLVLKHVIKNGKPLVIEGWEERLDPWTFTPKWLRDNHGAKVEEARSLDRNENIPLSVKHFLANMHRLADQYWTGPEVYSDPRRQRIYLKDIDCPPVWYNKLKEVLPPSIFYLNDSTGDVGGPGAVDEQGLNAAGRRKGKGIARSGDLMSSLPADMRAENLMCYIGHEGTYTPAHREMCASLGQNIMVEASRTVDENGQPERPGSSIWFMTESQDRHTVSEYWLSVLGHDIEVERHFAQLNAWSRAPFSVYIVEQRPGDLILIPPLAPHQVWNRGTRTMKVAWNRTTVETLELALNEALPKARVVCRDEQYKNKAIVYYTLQKYSALLTSALAQAEKAPSQEAAEAILYGYQTKQLVKDFKKLFTLYRDILLSEMLPLDAPKEKCEFLPYDSNVTCAYCRGNIFNRFLSCPSCKDQLGQGGDDPYDVCMHCYAMGRSCACLSNLQWVEQFKWKELTQDYEDWRKLIIAIDGDTHEGTPLPINDERRRYPKKTLAEVCKEQLKRRPWKDIRASANADKADDSEEEIEVNDDGTIKKIKKKRSKAWLKNHSPCHVCFHRHPNWKMTPCSKCDRWWCYGVLFRAHDLMPQTIMEDPTWECPHCRGVCSTGACRKDPRQQPYEPKGTLLGHDTKKVADARSVECLVDFSVSNLNWLRDDVDQPLENKRMKKRREEADLAKLRGPDHDADADADADSFEADANQIQLEYSPEEGTPIDPHLDGNNGASVRDIAIDPALQGDGDSDSGLLAPLIQANRSLQPPNPNLRGARPSYNATSGENIQNYEVPNGYLPATTAGYVAPSAHMYDADGDAHLADYQYPDPTEQNLGGPGDEDADFDPSKSQLQPLHRNPKSLKRPRQSDPDESIDMKPHPKSARPRVFDAGANALTNSRPRNEATKQFEKEKERKALEEARKNGRFMAVRAALTGKKKLVKLKINGAKLAQFMAQQTARHAMMDGGLGSDGADDQEDDKEEAEGDRVVLLTSDVVHEKAKGPAKPKSRAEKENGNVLRIPLERDEDFGARADRTERRKKKAEIDYEEVDVGSEEEAAVSGATPPATNGAAAGGKRRVSSYIARKHQNDEDLPDELPDNYRDSRRRMPVTEKEMAARRKTMPAKTTTAGERSTLRPAGASVVVVDDDRHGEDDEMDAEDNDEDTAEPTNFPSFAKFNKVSQSKSASHGITPAKDSPVPTKKPAPRLSMEEENRLAKLRALNMIEGSSEDEAESPASPEESDDSVSVVEHVPAPVAIMKAAPGPNLANRASKATKMASAAKGMPAAARASGMVVVNLTAKAKAKAAVVETVEDEDEDEDDSDGVEFIPAKAPVSARSSLRGRGRR